MFHVCRGVLHLWLEDFSARFGPIGARLFECTTIQVWTIVGPCRYFCRKITNTNFIATATRAMLCEVPRMYPVGPMSCASWGDRQVARLFLHWVTVWTPTLVSVCSTILYVLSPTSLDLCFTLSLPYRLIALTLSSSLGPVPPRSLNTFLARTTARLPSPLLRCHPPIHCTSRIVHPIS